MRTIFQMAMTSPQQICCLDHQHTCLHQGLDDSIPPGSLAQLMLFSDVSFFPRYAEVAAWRQNRMARKPYAVCFRLDVDARHTGSHCVSHTSSITPSLNSFSPVGHILMRWVPSRFPAYCESIRCRLAPRCGCLASSNVIPQMELRVRQQRLDDTRQRFERR